jgi:hypothetical protein
MHLFDVKYRASEANVFTYSYTSRPGEHFAHTSHPNEPVMKKAKYFKRGAVDLYCGYELPDDG